MVTASCKTDLITINEGVEPWVELTGATAGATPGLETDYYIQGTGCISKAFNATGLGSEAFDTTATGGITIASGNASLHWLYFAAPNAIGVLNSGGYRVAIGNLVGAYKMWKVLGNDTYPYGGWVNIAVNPQITADFTQGTPNTSTYFFGSAVYSINAVARGYPFGNDIIRHGRTIIITGGDVSNGYATFAYMASINDSINNRWGLLQAIMGGYLQKGLFQMGTVTTPVDFRDLNKNIFIQDTTRVQAGFNQFEVLNASSRVDWINISIMSMGTTSRGIFTVTDNADINFDTCTFTDMDTFTFKSASTILTTTFRRCNRIIQNGATFTGCRFENSTDTMSMLVSNPTLITGCTFISDGSNHAMEATTAGAYNWDNELIGYSSSDETDNSAFHNNSNGHIDLTIIGGTTPKVKNSGSSTTTIIIPEVTLTISAQVSLIGAEIRIYDLDDNPSGSLGTELQGTESCVTDTYSYNGSAGNIIWIQIMLDGYVEFGQQITMPTSSGNYIALLVSDINI